MTIIHAGPRRLQRTADQRDGTEGNREDASYDHLTVTPLTPVIGAEVDGIDLREPLDPAVFDELHRALLEWKVLFFRQQHLSSEQHRSFARLWGELEVHPFLPAGAAPEVVRFEKGADQKGYENIWHSDVSWREIPSLGSVLRCLECPAVGGDTLWADMAVAYDGLPDDVKARIDGLDAVHDFSNSFGLGLSPDDLAAMQTKFPPAVHPVVRAHPETGRKTLYVNGIFTSHIVGLERADSDALLAELCIQAQVPEYQCRFRWQPGSLAIWDNRATQHYAVSDYWPARRVMERATIIGDRPFAA